MKVNEAVYQSLKRDKPINVQQGGTSSGKTYGIMQHLLEEGARNNNEVITVYAEDIPALKQGAYRDAQNILDSEPDLLKWWPMDKGWWNKSDRLFKSRSGSILEFNSYDNELDARQGKRDRSFGNEANAILYGIFEQINLRTKKQAIIDFNPSARFWAHDNLHGLDEVEWNVTTFRDNAFLDEKTKVKILSYEPTPENIERGTANEYRWQVYGLGEVGRLEGLVFPDWKIAPMPDEYKWRVFGMDFGFTNDPTTLIEIRYKADCLYWKEHIFETGLTNTDISKRLFMIDHPKDEMIVADSAEPKSIEELSRMGWFIVGAEKGQDSINQGIDAIKRYNNYIDPRSKNLIEEFSSYTWAKDRNGNPTNKPIDSYNHGIDGGRYALTKKIMVKPYEPVRMSKIDFL